MYRDDEAQTARRHLEHTLAASAPALVTPPHFSAGDESDLDFLRGGNTIYDWPAAVTPPLETLAVTTNRKSTRSPMTSAAHALLR